MKIIVTQEHWDKAKRIDAQRYGNGRIHYCPIAQALLGMNFPNVSVRDDSSSMEHGYRAYYGSANGVITGCGVTVAQTFDAELPLPDGLLPCTIELPD